MLGRMLEGLPHHSYVLLTNSTRTYKNTAKTGHWLSCDYYFIDKSHPISQSELTNINRKTHQKRALLSALLVNLTSIQSLFTVPKLAQRIHADRSLHAILATSDNGPFLIGGYFAAKKLKLPLYIYLFDLYAGNALPFHVRWLAFLAEPMMFKYANKIIVTNRHTQEYLHNKYGFSDDKFVICPNPAQQRTFAPIKPRAKKTIVFTGNIYWAQQSNLRDLVQAVRTLPDLELHLYAPLTPEQFASMGLRGPNVITGSLSAEQAWQAQRQATILFLPMTFTKQSRDIVMTASPGKLSDYLAVGRPILVYAPPYSQIARYAREEGFAYVIDKQDPTALAGAITELLENAVLAKSLITKGQRLLAEQYNLDIIRQRFLDTIGQAEV